MNFNMFSVAHLDGMVTS